MGNRTSILDGGLRVPPHSIEAEQSLIGSLLIDNSAWERIDGLVQSEDLYRDEHRRIFRHIAALINAGKPADAITVAERIDQDGESEKTGGLAYLGEMAANTPTAANIIRYAEIVRERAVCRRLVTVGDSISARAFNTRGMDIHEIMDQSERELFAVCEDAAGTTEAPADITSILHEVVEHVQEAADRDDPFGLTGVATGYTEVDQMTAGLQSGDLIIVAGRPSMGKTSFALNIAEHVAINAGLPVLVFSMEMPKKQLGIRLTSSVGRIDHQNLRTGRLKEEEWGRMSFALGKLNQASIHIDDAGGLTAGEIRSRARRHARSLKTRLGLIVIDYLQLMSAMKTGENRATEISDMTRALKALAKDLGCPIILLSQLNRSVEQRPNKRPVMSDLRESGAIEQDADLIFFIYRDEVYNSESIDKGIAEIIIGKQRNGPIGTVKLTFLGAYTRFENYSNRSW